MNHNPLEARISELEMRLAFCDDSVQQLNQVITQQDRLLAELEEKVRILGQRLHTLQPNPIASAAEETPPPHY
jgi:SlyX protein